MDGEEGWKGGGEEGRGMVRMDWANGLFGVGLSRNNMLGCRSRSRGNRRGGVERMGKRKRKRHCIYEGAYFEYGVGKASWSAFVYLIVWTGQALQGHSVLV